jgi:hypothetical protein
MRALDTFTIRQHAEIPGKPIFHRVVKFEPSLHVSPVEEETLNAAAKFLSVA